MNAANPRPIRVLCVDDHDIVARGLKASIDIEPDLQWAGARQSADDLIDAYDGCSADIVLIDVDMPGADVFSELEKLHELRPGARSLILSAFARDRYVDAALTAGAWGYLTKSEAFDTIFNAIRTVMQGRYVFAPEVLERCEMVGGRLLPKRDTTSKTGDLSPREIQVLRMIAMGMSTKDIAAAIHRSVKRVESIRTGIMRTVGCDDRLELTRYAIREGLVEP